MEVFVGVREGVQVAAGVEVKPVDVEVGVTVCGGEVVGVGVWDGLEVEVAVEVPVGVWVGV